MAVVERKGHTPVSIDPYTRIQFVQDDLSVSRITATKYLDTLAASGILHKQRIGRANYYINLALTAILTA
ncbi:MAG: hypothetical protein ABJE47_21220 [bacterium]